MNGLLPISARRERDAASSQAAEVMLFQFEHATLSEPLRVSSDPTERLSTEPLAYGTRSTWNGADPITQPYRFVTASASLPSDLEDGASPAQFVLDNVDRRIGDVLRQITGQAVVHIAVVYSLAPDQVDQEIRNLRLMDAQGDTSQITLTISREPIEDERFPTARFTKDRFPGLFR